LEAFERERERELPKSNRKPENEAYYTQLLENLSVSFGEE
jgi:hypothetical protein